MKFELVLPERDKGELARCNRVSGAYGLTLTQGEMEHLTLRRGEALRRTGRVEFGGGVLAKLVAGFCDSPDLDRGAYEATLEELQDLFYALKGECREALSDDELIWAMRLVYDRTGGSLDYLAGLDRETLFGIVRRGGLEEPDGGEYDG